MKQLTVAQMTALLCAARKAPTSGLTDRELKSLSLAVQKLEEGLNLKEQANANRIRSTEQQ